MRFSFIALEMDIDIVVFSGGANIHAFLFALGDTVIFMGVIFVLIKIFYAKFNKQGPILRNVSASAYHMYLVHPPILVAISVGLTSLGLYPIIKVAIVFPLTILLCYLVSHFILEKIHLRKRTRVTQNS